MKRLNITYDTAEIENGEKIVGETCYTVEFADDRVADRLLDLSLIHIFSEAVGTTTPDKGIVRHPLTYLLEAADDIAYSTACLLYTSPP